MTSATLLEKLTAAMGEKTLTRKVRYYASFDLLIIDEFGFDKLERREYPESASLLYKVVDARSGRGSTAFVTNVDFSDWSEYLGDPPLVIAMLDRVVDNAIVLRFEGSRIGNTAPNKSKLRLINVQRSPSGSPTSRQMPLR